ncbi:MAG: RNA polymerase sigma factor [Bacteroidetes bacterium]|nr:MAG: RNA polymerase sigma factor [Bacteroidota bacterium]
MKSQVESQQIVLLLKQKSEEGFSLLYDNYSANLLSLITFITKSKEVAEDILQDTFIRVWKNIELYDAHKGTFYTWMLNIARNLSIDYLRKQKKHLQIDNLQIEESGVFRIEYMDFEDILKLLDVKQSKAIDLVYFQGYTHEQAAVVLSIPLGTLKSRVKLGLKKLKNHFRCFHHAL